MTQAARKLTFEEYASLDTNDWRRIGLPEGRREYVEGELVEVPSESELNDWIAMVLRDIFVQYTNRRLVRVARCEVEVPGKPRTQYPDLVILREEHLSLTQKRLFITLKMPLPQLVVEVVSPGNENQRDYTDKREQYQKTGIPEYWLINPEYQAITVLELRNGRYFEIGCFQGNSQINSPIFPNLSLTAEQVFVMSL